MGIGGDDDRRKVMADRTGDQGGRGVGGIGGDLLAEWRDDLWKQDLYGKPGIVLARPTALRATSSRSPEAVARSLLAGRSWSTARSRRSRISPSTRTGSASGRRRSSRPARRQDRLGRSGVTARPGIVASFATIAPDDERLTELLLGGGELTWLAGPHREGRPALPRHRRQRLRVPQAVRAHRRRALARARPGRSRCIRSSRSPRHVPSTAAAATRCGPATSGQRVYLRSCLSGNAAVPTIDYF